MNDKPSMVSSMIEAPAAHSPRPLGEADRPSRLWGIISGTHSLALVDQALVSGASFVTTVAIGRWSGSNQLGFFAIGASLLVSALTIHNAVIAVPYMINRQQPIGSAQEDAGSAIAHLGLLSALVTLVLAACSVGMSAYGAEPELVAMGWALAGAAPFALAREFSRQFAFAHLRLWQAVAVDAATATIQISLLGWLVLIGRMSAPAALAAIGAGCAAPAVAWALLSSQRFAFDGRVTWAALKRNWRLGKSLLANQLALQVQTYVVYWISLAIGGAAVTGAYAACMSVVLFANPFILGVGNVLTPRSVVAWKNGGGDGLRGQVMRDSLLIGAGMSLFTVAIFFGGEDVIRLLFHRREYEAQGHLIAVLALAQSASALSNPAANALASMGRPGVLALVNSIGAAITVFLVWALMVEGGLLWAAYGLLIGYATTSTGRWVAFLAIVGPRCADAGGARRAFKSKSSEPMSPLARSGS